MRSAWSKAKRLCGCGRDPAVASALPAGVFNISWRQIVSPKRLSLLFWLYVVQAVAGSAVGFAVPFLYYFGVL
jgi:hypothetical protein